MAVLSPTNAREILEEPRHGKQLEEAVTHDNRVSMHADPVISVTDYGDAHKRFMGWVKSLLPADKYGRFQQLFTPPIYTNELLDSIYKDLEKVFEPRNAYASYEFESTELEADFLQYLSSINDKAFWRNEWYSAFKSAPNSVLVIDMPKEMEGQRPDPYAYIIDTKRIIDIKNTKVKNVSTTTADIYYTYKTEYIAFWKNSTEAVVIDDETYRVFECTNSKFTLTLESEHNIGYCPAKQIYSDPINRHTNIVKKSPVTASLRSLDYLLFQETSEELIDMFAPYPIVTKYASKCEYMDVRSGAVCEGGVLEYEVKGNITRENCPECENRKLIGPGTVSEVKAPSDSAHPDNIDSIKFVSSDTKNLEYITSKREEKEKNIRLKIVGVGNLEDNGQAKNTEQVQARFESRVTVLRNIAKNLEIITKFTHDTYAVLRYRDQFKESTVFAGDQFFLKNEVQETEQLKLEKDAGLPEAEITLQLDKVESTKHKDNPNLLKRVKFLAFVEPYRGKNIKDLTDLQATFSSSLNEIDITIKINFDSFIRRYELEEQTIEELLAMDLQFDTKVSMVQVKLNEYATQELGIEEGEEAAPPPPSALNGAQVTALAGIIKDYNAGIISKQSAAAAIKAAYGYTSDQVEDMLGDRITPPNEE